MPTPCFPFPTFASVFSRLGLLPALLLAVLALLPAQSASAQATFVVGNVVFIDYDGDGKYTQGVDDAPSGVTVQLFAATDDPLVDSPVDVTTTAFNGTYLFSNVPAGDFKVYIPKEEFEPSGHLYGLICLPTAADGDDNAGQNAVPDAAPATNGIATTVFTLSEGNEPTLNTSTNPETGFQSNADDTDDTNGNLTIDLGFFPPVAVGNLVFADANNDGVASVAEGKPGVWVEIYDAETEPSSGEYLAHVQTGAGGKFLFSGLRPGWYKLFVPASEFGVGAVLEGASSVVSSAPPGSDDDAGEDGSEEANPAANGVQTDPFALFPTLAPTAFDGETGIGSDDDDLTADANTDLTRDFGVVIPNADLSVGNLVFVDADKNGIYSTGEGKQGVIVQLFRENEVTPLSFVETGAGGTYLFTGLLPGNYFVRVPAAEFAVTGSLYGYISVTGVGTTDVDDNIDENGRDDMTPHLQGVSSSIFTLSAGNEPVDAATETGYAADSDNATDSNANLTIDLGFVCPAMTINPTTLPNASLTANYSQTLSASGGVGTLVWDVQTGALPTGINLSTSGVLSGTPTTIGQSSFTIRATGAGDCVATKAYTLEVLPAQLTSVGNLVFIDADGDHLADEGEGIDGITLKLFPDTETDPEGGTALQQTTTASGGRYSFTGLTPGRYFIHIPSGEFGLGAELYQKTSIQGYGADIGADDNADENGVDNPDYLTEGISSVVFNLVAGSEPTDSGTETGLNAADDNATDSSSDFTIDLGFEGACPALSLTPSIIPSPTANHSYSQVLSGSGGMAPYTFVVQTGSLPVGLTLTPSGTLSGIATAAGVSNFTIRVTDNAMCSTDVPVTVTVLAEVAIGNLVFFDVNANGHADASEGVNGVIIDLYNGSDTPGTVSPIATQTTASGGRYLFDHLVSGSYKLHVRASNFASAASPLYRLASMGGSIDNSDDDTGEDGLGSDPVGSGIATAAFTVTAGAAPTSATYEDGLFASSDDTADADTDLTHDFGFEDATPLPATWATWLASHSLAPGTSPTANNDNDSRSNLLEYALNTNPLSGMPSATAPLGLTLNTNTQRYDFAFVRRRGGLTDVTYSVVLIADLANSPAGWSTTSITPAITINADGTETLTFANIDQESLFTGLPRGFVRLNVGLDTTGDGNADTTVASATYGWDARTYALRNQTSSAFFLRAEVFSGAIDAVAATTLDVTTSAAGGNVKAQFIAGREYYVEITSGTYEGQRWEIDEAASTATSIVLLPANTRSTLASVPAELVGSPLVVLPHQRVNDFFPAAAFRFANSSNSADQIIFFERANSSYTTLWSFTNSGNPRWITGVAIATDAGLRSIAPSEGFFVRAKLNPVLIKTSGIVRTWDTACPLGIGNNFIGNPWPVAQTPTGRNMSASLGFTTANAFTRADRINIWAGDSTTSSGYTGYYLLTSGAISNRWVRQSDLTFANQGPQSLFQPGAAAFIVMIAAKSDWVIPLPWTP